MPSFRRRAAPGPGRAPRRSGAPASRRRRPGRRSRCRRPRSGRSPLPPGRRRPPAARRRAPPAPKPPSAPRGRRGRTGPTPRRGPAARGRERSRGSAPAPAPFSRAKSSSAGRGRGRPRRAPARRPPSCHPGERPQEIPGRLSLVELGEAQHDAGTGGNAEPLAERRALRRRQAGALREALHVHRVGEEAGALARARRRRGGSRGSGCRCRGTGRTSVSYRWRRGAAWRGCGSKEVSQSTESRRRAVGTPARRAIRAPSR